MIPVTGTRKKLWYGAYDAIGHHARWWGIDGEGMTAYMHEIVDASGEHTYVNRSV